MKRCLLATIIAVLIGTTILQALDDGVSAARDLYAAAAYEDALAVLNKLRTSEIQPEEARAVEQYRAFCLLALGRRDDAEQAIAAVVSRAPGYHPSDADASPRVRSAFSDVRKRMLPTIVQAKYADAKAVYDRKDYVNAASQFKLVLELLDDPDLGLAAGQPPLADLRTLAGGFRDLAVVAAAPPPPPPAPAPTPPPVVEAPAPTGPVRGHIYGAGDTDVVPPVVVRQELPAFDFRTGNPLGQGILEVVIGENGNVVAAVMRTSVLPRYDMIIVESARSWRYKPATLQGVPVMYRKAVAIAVKRTP